eukprot:1159255-Pelagomonas_calceolata.AAC.1
MAGRFLLQFLSDTGGSMKALNDSPVSHALSGHGGQVQGVCTSGSVPCLPLIPPRSPAAWRARRG